MTRVFAKPGVSGLADRHSTEAAVHESRLRGAIEKARQVCAICASTVEPGLPCASCGTRAPARRA
jgi:hypothetical protein